MQKSLYIHKVWIETLHFYWFEFQRLLKKGSKDEKEKTWKIKKVIFIEFELWNKVFILYSFESFVEFRQSLDIGCKRNFAQITLRNVNVVLKGNWKPRQV